MTTAKGARVIWKPEQQAFGILWRAKVGKHSVKCQVVNISTLEPY